LTLVSPKSLKPYKPFTTRWLLDDADKTIALPLPVAGEYDFVVDWGDGTTGIVTAYNDADISHTYATEGVKIVSIKGKMTHWGFNNTGDKLKITDVLSGGSTGLTSLYGGFTAVRILSLSLMIRRGLKTLLI